VVGLVDVGSVEAQLRAGKVAQEAVVMLAVTGQRKFPLLEVMGQTALQILVAVVVAHL
jgi:hypothetical protein